MKRYGFLSIALAAALTFGCNTKNDKDVNAANPPAGGAVGTAGSEDHNVSNGDKDFVKWWLNNDQNRPYRTFRGKV
jgi:hypothetical protein